MRRFLLVALCLPCAAIASDETKGWGYDEATGPEHWGTLSAEFAMCNTGRSQSPIELTKSPAGGAAEVQHEYRAVPLSLVNTGHTVMLNAAGGGRLVENGRDYGLVQAHFHTPSEHVMGGDSYPAEVHFVHQADDKSLSVVGVLVAEGAANPELARIIEHLPATPGAPVVVEGKSFDPAALMPEGRGVFRYMGSLTTPPCSENVAWHVLAQPITASAEQIASLAQVMGENNRPIQPGNDRPVVNLTGGN